MRSPCICMVVAVVAGCSEPSAPVDAYRGVDDAGLDAATGADVGIDAGPVAPPAFPALPSVGGSVLASPQLVTVTYADDPNRDALEAYGHAMAGDPWWSAAVGEYGVGALTWLGDVRTADAAPTSGDDRQIQVRLTELATAGLLPTAADGSYEGIVFVVYLPSTAAIRLSDGASPCSGWHGVHGEIRGAAHLVYALALACGSARGLDELGYLEAAASHEVIEAATDPYIGRAPAYEDVSTSPSPWSIYRELTDRCAGSYLHRPGYVLARNWSNAAAATPGADPCVPAPEASVYYGVSTPETTLHVQAGTTIDVPIAGWAAGPVPDFRVRTWEVFGIPTGAVLDDVILNDGVRTMLHVSIPPGTYPGSTGWVDLLSSPDWGDDHPRENGDSRNYPLLFIVD